MNAPRGTINYTPAMGECVTVSRKVAESLAFLTGLECGFTHNGLTEFYYPPDKARPRYCEWCGSDKHRSLDCPIVNQ